MKISVEAVGPLDISEVKAFLSQYEDSSQFLINNLRTHGPVLSDHPNSGNYRIIKTGGKISSVFCLSRRGNLLLQSVRESDVDSNHDGSSRNLSQNQLILSECEKDPVSISGFIGDWDSVKPVYRLFQERKPTFSPGCIKKEILFSYQLNEGDPKLKRDARVRFLELADFPQWLSLQTEYMAKISIPDDLSQEQRRRDFESQIADKVWWGLFDRDKILSRAALNSKGERVGQVGGVFTPRESRQNGFAKALI